MKEKAIVFNGSVAQNYDDCLGPFVFEPFALDLLERIDTTKTGAVLELACGTGRVTKHLTEKLPVTSIVMATDLNAGMIAVAKEKVLSPAVKWATVDMTNIPFDENNFDLIVCQFGLMFAPDKLKALIEIRRVLKEGGKLIFNTWDSIENNKIWQTTNDIVNSFLSDAPTTIFKDGPFAMHDEKAVLQLLEQAGFNNSSVASVNKTGQISTAALAAKGFIQGLPVLNTIREKIPASLPAILKAVEKEYVQQFSDQPLKAALQAWVFEATK